ncbi:MAG: tRNA pseudouridine(13) synthase TruD [Gammaproteobacteria bacterium]|nr:tRNA pseudouridine(13) synthase TruD [Gammaproteobacteria bacterium]
MFDYDGLAFQHIRPVLSAHFKTEHDDFLVDEIMPVSCSGEGEHVWLQITKQGCNTEHVAKELQKFAQVKQVAVSYAGLKDRHGITTQWFSVQLPGQQGPDWHQLDCDSFQVQQICRHSRKLKRGTLSGNRFNIRLSELQGEQALWQQQLELIATKGVPNYFGQQRFGHSMGNLSRATELIAGNKMRRLKPFKRGLYLSAMRSWIFNRIVSQRLVETSFDQPLVGDVYMLAASQACFDDALGEDDLLRLSQADIHITAALWGRGQAMVSAQAAQLEQAVVAEFSDFTSALEQAGLKQERRAMRLMPAQMQWQFGSDNTLSVSFELIKGSYATAVLRELCQIKDMSK